MSERTDFVAVETYIRHSAIVSAIETMGRAWRIARDQSTTARWLRRTRAGFVSLPLTSRVRAVSVAALSAAGAYLLLLKIVPAQVAPALPRAVWMLVMASAAFTAVSADRVVAAWSRSSVRRLWRTVFSVDR